MLKDIYLAGGCFWGAEHFFKQMEGVVLTEVGFANGHTPDPTYKEVYTDTTGYAETVHVRYDTDRVGLKFLLRMFFMASEPRNSEAIFPIQPKLPNIRKAAGIRAARLIPEPPLQKLLATCEILSNGFRAEKSPPPCCGTTACCW